MGGLDYFCNSTVFPYVYNLTSSYADQNNEATTVATSVIMFILAALFFNLNLFSRISDVSAILNPSVRLFLSTSLSLFLPVMSYLFSEAKNKKEGAPIYSQQQLVEDLSLRARTILMWMLLVELLRKKVEAILVSMGMEWYSSGTIERFARIIWLGYLVFNNVKGTGKKAIYGTLWVLAAAKFLQRVVITELLKRSFAYGKNAQLLNSYMAQVIVLQPTQGQEQQSVGGSQLLDACKYAVMGEDSLEREAGPHGYQVNADHSSGSSTIVTVGDIWASDSLLLKENHRLRRLCLSFALYKLLRRRFEDIPISNEETRNCQDLIFRGLCKEEVPMADVPRKAEEEEEEQSTEDALFEVFNDEIQFISEYYHSVLPVVLSNPFFFLANYILFPIVVWAFCLLTFVACGNGNVSYAYHSITKDNYIIDTGAATLAKCLLKSIIRLPVVLFATIDLSTTTLLFLAFIYEQVWELLVFILSNWLTVSLICEYATKPHWRESKLLSGLMRCIQWVRSKLGHPKLRFEQFSVLRFCPLSSLLSFTMPTKAVSKEVKKCIVDCMVAHMEIDGPRNTTSWSKLQLDKHKPYRPLLSQVCESKSIAEFTLICHIATSLLEVKYQHKELKETMEPHRKVATTLSKYCAYLVACSPELLPEDKNGTERTCKNMKKEFKEKLGRFWWYHLWLQRTGYKGLTKTGKRQQEAVTVVQKGAKLGTDLMDKAAEDNEHVWELMADLWTEVMVYIAPSGNELHVKAHKEALAKGGGFITVLWAICTHTSIKRPALAPWEAARRAFQEP